MPAQKATLAAAEVRGVVLGAAGHTNLKPNIAAHRKAADSFEIKPVGVISGMRVRSLTQRDMVDELNALGVKTARDGASSLVQVQRVITRLNA